MQEIILCGQTEGEDEDPGGLGSLGDAEPGEGVVRPGMNRLLEGMQEFFDRVIKHLFGLGKSV